MNRAWKQPSEERVFPYDFSELLGAETIAEIISAVSVARTGVTTLVKDAEAFTATSAQIKWSGGTDGITYATTVKVRDTAGQEHEIDADILVVNTSFVLPVGITSTYVSGEEYVARFGFEETVRITDEQRKGTIDGEALMAALADASQYADSYLAGRYTLPLATPVPEVLKKVVADLAREALHKTRPTPSVTANADRARSALKDLSAGRAVLLLEAGEVVESAATAGPQWSVSDDATVFNSEKMARY
jgi:phage gp36-like protein